MLSYCLKCKRNTESIDPKVLDSLGLSIVPLDHSLKIKKEYKSLNTLEIQDIFTNMN